jgi:hypothetical protein
VVKNHYLKKQFKVKDPHDIKYLDSLKFNSARNAVRVNIRSQSVDVGDPLNESGLNSRSVIVGNRSPAVRCRSNGRDRVLNRSVMKRAQELNIASESNSKLVESLDTDMEDTILTKFNNT